ncbi:hypothetical protein JAO73_07855 [Hymenobacter sp. BT523]|uniref:hypothetical protein n=1 Tax=Hymenobacter sp. BT523 TaxID=2795725 RepID=UPI0018EAE270|nr:hypothetical protein [Hymenobacter sp. BT523]MBJ6108918.1 hypothetical protein [Hymenobacter sp. BT523]
MLRSFLTLALSMFLLAEASAQTTPVASTKKTARATKVAARKAAKARRVAVKSAPAAPLNDGWPPIENNTQTAVASNDGWGSPESVMASSPSRGEIDNQNISAAPGMPVHVRTSNGLTPYSVRPPRKPAATQTTLGN